MPPRKKRAKIGTPSRDGARDEPAVHVELDDEPGWPCRADSRSGRSRAWRRNSIVGAEPTGRELGRGLEVDAARREEPVVAGVVGERGADARGESALKRFASGKPLEHADDARGAEEVLTCCVSSAVVLAGVGDADARSHGCIRG